MARKRNKIIICLVMKREKERDLGLPLSWLVVVVVVVVVVAAAVVVLVVVVAVVVAVAAAAAAAAVVVVVVVVGVVVVVVVVVVAAAAIVAVVLKGQAYGKTDIQTDGETWSNVDRPTGRQTTYRQSDRQLFVCLLLFVRLF